MINTTNIAYTEAINASKSICLNDFVWRDIFKDFCALVLGELTRASVDQRNIAKGINNTGLWVEELCLGADHGFLSIFDVQNVACEQTLMTKHPEKVLLSSYAGLFAMQKYFELNPTSSIFCMNNYYLAMYEKFFEDATGVAISCDYSSIEVSDIVSGVLGEIDFIECYSWELDPYNTLLQAMIDSLSPKGVLFINATNLNESLYRDGVLHSPAGELHTFLQSQPGYTYHVPVVAGYTVFIKQ